jgi:serine/threonine protein phosphatase 1
MRSKMRSLSVLRSITMQPELLPNRIGIDTGAFNTGVLTALVLEGKEQRLLQTG